MNCECCKKNVTGNFICVNGGALLKDENEPNSSSMSSRIDEFLSITTHCNENGVYKHVDIVEFNNTSDGQFEWYFCSKKCVRQFFNNWLDKIPDVGEEDGK